MKFKQLIISLLVCILCVASTSAVADSTENEDLFTAAYFTENMPGITAIGIQNIAWVNDNCYAYLSDMSVYTWSAADGLQKLCQLPDAPEAMQSDYVVLSDEDIAVLKETVTYTAAGDDALYGFNVYSGKFGIIDADGIHWSETILDLSCLNPDENFFPNRVAECFVIDDTLFTFVSLHNEYTSGNYAFYGFDVNTGASAAYEVDTAVGICPMDDESFLLLCYENDEYSLKQLNTATNTVTALDIPMGEVASATEVGGLAYDAERQIIALAADGKLYTSTQKEELLSVTNIATNGLQGETTAAFLSDGRYALWLDGVHLKAVSVQEENRQLTCQAPALSDPLRTSFTSAYPDIAFKVVYETTTAEDLANLLTTQDDSVDVFEVRADYTYDILKQKGMAATLNSDSLTQNLHNMYSAIQEALTDADGHLVAYPSRFYLYLYQYNQGFWNLAFEGEEFPSSMEELMDYWLRWEQDYADEYPEIEFVENFDYETWCMNMITMYIRQHDEDGQAPDLSDSDLRNVLEKLQQIVEIREAAGRHTTFLSMDDYDGMACIFSINTREAMRATSSFYMTSSEEYLYDIYMYDYTNVTMKFSADDDVACDGRLYVYVVNPYSKNQAEALKFIETAAQMEMNPYLYYAIYPDCNTPYENPSFAENIAKYTEEKASLEKARETAEEEALENIDYQLEYYTKYLEDQENQRWMISENTITETRQLLEKVNLHVSSFYLGSNGTSAYDVIAELCTRYCGGNLSMDAFLNELTNKITMMQLESK